MKNILIVLVSIVALSAHALPFEQGEPDRALRTNTLNNGYFNLEITNYGHNKEMHVNDGTMLLSNSSIWISGKKFRRDAEGRQLYWLTYPPTIDAMQTVYEGHPDWTPTLVAVQDTLTSIGFDGDLDLYELLPAYNALVAGNLDMVDLYNTYNEQDRVLRSVMGYPAPLPFDPFNSETYCFTIPQPHQFDTPGFITNSAYYYDYCPFGTLGDRDLGQSRTRNTHYPLGLAVHQESYFWTLLDYHRMMITKYTVYNTNDLDSIEDVAIGHFVDADMGPSSWGADDASFNDLSGYVKGPGYEFAYSRESNIAGYVTHYHIASKIMFPELNHQNRACWYWQIGDGPDDYNPLRPYYAGRNSNQKYWLLSGRNPDLTKYEPLRCDHLTEFEQYEPRDTRFLHSLFGAQPNTPEYDLTDDDGNYTHRFNLAPGESFSFYTVLFIGDDIDDLKSQSLAIENFVSNDFYIDPNSNQPCYPYVTDLVAVPPNAAALTWRSFNDPDHFVVAYRIDSDQENDWTLVTLPGSTRHHLITDMNPNANYEMKVGAYYYTPEEVYLESETFVRCLSTSTDDNTITPAFMISSYPNPFKDVTTIQYDLKQAGEVTIDVYNIRGQKVRRLFEGNVAAGKYQLDWDARDERGKTCSDGIYFLKMKSDNLVQHKKISLIK